MSFTRVNPGSWGVGGIVTSGQMNQLDQNVSSALDKSSAGDTLSGFININPLTGGIGAGVGGAVGVSAGNSITLSWNPANSQPFIGVGVSAGIPATQSGAILSEVANGILATAAGGITTTVGGGISDGVTGGIRINNQHGIQSQPFAGNGIILNGGATEYIDYQTTRSFTVCHPITGAPMQAGWASAAWGPHRAGHYPGSVVAPAARRCTQRGERRC